ncbi:hypothetical protein B566_EDAN011487 [Ephemera danica]|nr:hypothetical protein B566_EDAN011487 [Ephemera danica]
MMERPQVQSETFAEMLTSEMDIEEHPIKVEVEQLDCLPDGMEGTEVTTEPTDELLTSKIEIEEHPINFDPEELDCFDGES